MIRTSLSLALVFGAVFAASGCGNLNRTPRYEAPEAMTIKTFKRETENQSQDYIINWKRDAYSKVTRPITRGVSPDQKDVLARHGQPDYLRKSWRALNADELVDEWAYWDRNVCVQFVQGQLVWEGPLTDMDRIRIQYGYPKRSSTQKVETGVRRDVWDYQGMTDSRGMIFTFTEEKLVSENRY